MKYYLNIAENGLITSNTETADDNAAVVLIIQTHSNAKVLESLKILQEYCKTHDTRAQLTTSVINILLRKVGYSPLTSIEIERFLIQS